MPSTEIIRLSAAEPIETLISPPPARRRPPPAKKKPAATADKSPPAAERPAPPAKKPRPPVRPGRSPAKSPAGPPDVPVHLSPAQRMAADGADAPAATGPADDAGAAPSAAGEQRARAEGNPPSSAPSKRPEQPTATADDGEWRRRESLGDARRQAAERIFFSYLGSMPKANAEGLRRSEGT